MSNPPSTITRRAVTRGAAWTAPVLTMAATAPSLAASPKKDCYVFDMWSSNSRQPINNKIDQISGTVRYSPNNYQDCAAKNQLYPHNITITVTLDPSVYTGAFTYSGPGTASGSGNVVTIILPFTGKRQGSSIHWNLTATTRAGVTREQATGKVSVQATSYPEAKWKIIEQIGNASMINRTPSSYVY
ncbi:hypothetical protein DUHN55_21800 [Helicobacter pylori]